MAISRVESACTTIFHPCTIKQWAKEETSSAGTEVTRIPVRDNFPTTSTLARQRVPRLPSKGYTRDFFEKLDHPLVKVRDERGLL
jgi:UDP-galactopyranose mutase